MDTKDFEGNKRVAFHRLLFVLLVRFVVQAFRFYRKIDAARRRLRFLPSAAPAFSFATRFN
jgi:hypothetical protein